MNVVYDLVGFQSRDHGERGIARYVLHLGLAIEAARPGLVTQYLAHPDLPFPAGAEPLVATGRVVRTDQGFDGRRPCDGGIYIQGSPFECFNQPAELVLPAFARSPRWRSLAVIHDLIPAIFPDLYLTNTPDRIHYTARLNALSGFDRFLTNSQASADDAFEMLGIEPDHITLVGAGADSQFRPPANGHHKAASELVTDNAVPGLRPGFILFPTGIDPRKNIERTIQAYGRLPKTLRDRHQLAMACRLSDPDREIVQTMAKEAGVPNELLVTGYVSDQTLCRLYQAAELVVFPSYYEGFGLPALEAMKCQAPVICADATSLKEVQLIDEARFDPMSVTAIAAAIEQALGDENFRNRLRNQEHPPFSWQTAGERAVAAIERVGSHLADQDEAATRNHVQTGARVRLALFTPLPPQSTPVADYATRLLRHLSRLCDVTVFVDTDPAYVWAPRGVAIEAACNYESVVSAGGAFDETLYFIGNDGCHVGILEALKTNPGPVLLHDVRLTELYGYLQRNQPDQLVDGSVGKTLASLYPGRYRHEVEEMDTISDEVANRFGVLMAKEVAKAATDIFVHSSYAAAMVDLDTCSQAEVLFPMPCPTERGETPAAKHRHDDRQRRPVISAFGAVAPSKQPQTLITALAVLTKRHPMAQLSFVGPIEAGYQQELAEVAAQQGVGASVEFTGPLSENDYANAVRDASVGVQLSTSSNDASTTVAELLASGTPTVVTRLGPMSELPDDVVVKVDVDPRPEHLGQTLAELIFDEDRQAELASRAIDYAKTHSFAAAAETLLEALLARDQTNREAHMDELLAPIKQTQDQALFYLDMLKNGQATYLGDHQVLTRLYTGQKMFVDSRDISLAPSLIMDGRWEPETTDVLMGLIKPSDCFIDLGANMGYFGIIAGTVINKAHGGSIHMIEANAGLIPLVFKSLNVTGLVAHSTISNFAVSDTSGQELELNVPTGLWGSAFLGSLDQVFRDEVESSIDKPLEVGAPVAVTSVTLDDFCMQRDIDRVDLIKIDIEGHEERAYQGMSKVIDNNRDHLRMLMEFSGGQYDDPVKFFDQLKSDFTHVFAIVAGTGGSRLVEVATYADVAALSTPGFAMLLLSNDEVAHS